MLFTDLGLSKLVPRHNKFLNKWYISKTLANLQFKTASAVDAKDSSVINLCLSLQPQGLNNSIYKYRINNKPCPLSVRLSVIVF